MKTKETGHAKNVANFANMIDFCKGYGSEYNPGGEGISIIELTTVLQNSKLAVKALKDAETAYDNATNIREIAFSPLKKFSTRLLAAITATKASKLTISDARSINLKIQGRRAGELPVQDQSTNEDEQVSAISVSQQGFDSLLDNFTSLTNTITAEPLFTPNEVQLQPAALAALLTDLENKNEAVRNAITQLSNCRINRNKIMYFNPDGLFETVPRVKGYVKSVYGAGSPELKRITSIRFTKPPKSKPKKNDKGKG